MTLYFRKAEKLIDDLSDYSNIVCLVYQGKNGIGGFQSDSTGHDIRFKLTDGAIALSYEGTTIVTPENHLKSLKTITEPKYKTLLHALNDKEKQLEMLNDFFKKKLIFDIKKSKGLSAVFPVALPLYKEILSCNTLQDIVNVLINYCQFISIWPSYCGVFGQNCFIASHNIDSAINALPTMLSLNEPLKYISDADMVTLNWI